MPQSEPQDDIFCIHGDKLRKTLLTVIN